MSASKTEPCERAKLLTKAVSRWDNEGGAGEGGRVQPVSGALLTDALPLTQACTEPSTEIAHVEMRQGAALKSALA